MGKEQTGKGERGRTTNEARKRFWGRKRGHSLQREGTEENKTKDPKILQCI